MGAVTCLSVGTPHLETIYKVAGAIYKLLDAIYKLLDPIYKVLHAFIDHLKLFIKNNVIYQMWRAF